MEEGDVLQRKGPSLTALLRWSGLALVAGGLLMIVATVLHPSRETPATIVEAEVRLVAAHALLTLSYLLVLLGLPGLYGAASVRMGRLGLVGFLLAFLGTMLIAVSGNFGFLAPVLAAESPQTIDAINRYLPEVPQRRGLRRVRGRLRHLRGGHGQDGGLPSPLWCARHHRCPLPSGWVRSGPARRTEVVGHCHPWERGPWRRPGLAWLPHVAASGVLTAIADADRTNRPHCHQSSSTTAQVSIPLGP